MKSIAKQREPRDAGLLLLSLDGEAYLWAGGLAAAGLAGAGAAAGWAGGAGTPDFRL